MTWNLVRNALFWRQYIVIAASEATENDKVAASAYLPLSGYNK